MKTNKLIQAIEKCDINTAKLLIESGADVDAKDNEGMTPLMHGAIHNSSAGGIGIANLLIDAGADVNAKSNAGNTALMYAIFNAFNGRLKMAKLLIEAGADVNARNDKGYTALMETAKRLHNTEIAKLLIEAGADINAKNISRDDNGTTALMLAFKHANTEIAELLLEAQRKRRQTELLVEAEIHACDFLGHSAMYYAIEKIKELERDIEYFKQNN